MNASVKLLMGVPRSGTTLTCHLLNDVDDTVALHEPIPASTFDGVSGLDEAARRVSAYIEASRLQIRSDGTAPSKVQGGLLPANSLSSVLPEDGLRQEVVEAGILSIRKPLSDEYVLVVKHNALFASLLDRLKQAYPCFAIVRNPVAAMASWQTVDLPVNHGRIPMGERFDKDLQRRLDTLDDRLDRQVEVLRWFFDRFTMLNSDAVIRYEDIIASNGACLGLIAGSVTNTASLRNQNNSHLYENLDVLPILQRLLKTAATFAPFYNEQDLTELAEQLL